MQCDCFIGHPALMCNSVGCLFLSGNNNNVATGAAVGAGVGVAAATAVVVAGVPVSLLIVC